MDAEFFEPSKDDCRTLAQRWVSVSGLVRADYGYVLDQSMTDLDYLQRVIDDGRIDVEDALTMDCLGVAFARVMATNEEGMDWWVVVDDYGRDLVLRYRETSLQLDAMHMIGKQMADGGRVDVRALYAAVMNYVAEVKCELGE
jgi:hypothetical protein